MRKGPKRKPINYRLALPGSTSAASADSAPVPPLPVGQAVAALPGQYLRVLTRPSSGTFLEEKDKGSWALVWIQLLGSITLGIAVRLLIAATSTQGVSLNILRVQLLALAIGGPLLFFLSVGIQYGVARWLSVEKAGTYLAQCYTTLLFGVPLGIVASLFAFIPGMGRWLYAAVGFYELVLTTLAIKAVHHVGGGKALLATLAPMGLIIVFAGCVFGFLVVVRPG
jgi:hypothetical protein